MLIYQTGYKQINGIMISKCKTKCAVQVIKISIFIRIYCRWIPEIKKKDNINICAICTCDLSNGP